ncbi:MAG: hypothetical protein EXR55_04495 [Dehalococcoidia bacterium]|nr:hypothetical protein [Dehalococcoidia bacterium]
MNEVGRVFPALKARIFTDASGLFFTVVTEHEFPSLGDWGRSREIFSDPRFPALFERMVPLVESGWREFWNIVEELAPARGRPRTATRPRTTRVPRRRPA